MSAQPMPAQPLQLREYLAVLRARRASVIATAAITLTAALFVSLRMTPVYTSTAKVLVKPITANETLLSGTSTSTLNLDTESQLVSSAVVARLAADALHSAASPSELMRHVGVSVPSNTEILEISYSSPSPITAQRTAQAFADAYLDFKRSEALATYRSVSSSIQGEINDLQQKLDRAQYTSQHSVEGSAAKQRADNDVSLLASQIALLRNQMASLTTLDIDPGAVVQRANLPDAPSSPNHLLNGALGLFVGLALGVGLAFLRERLDDRLRGREDLEEHVGAPTLVAIPRVADWKNGELARLATVEDPRGPAAEAYKTLRTSLLFAAAQRGLKSIMVCSAEAGEGKSTTAANLAVVLAQTGKRVVLVSGDLRKPRIARFFQPYGGGVETEVGLSSVLTGESSLQDALQHSGVDNLWLLTAGPVPAQPAEMAQSSAMGELLEALHDSADFTIVDSAPTLVVTDAAAMAPHVDGVLFVADAARTTRGAVARARVQLDHVGAPMIGAVLNNFDPSKAGAYSYEPYRYAYVYRSAEPVSERGARTLQEALPRRGRSAS